MIERNLEALLLQKLKRSPAVAILGPRQMGKTTLAKHLKPNGRESIYLDMENPNDQNKLHDPFSYLASHKNSRKCLLRIATHLTGMIDSPGIHFLVSHQTLFF